MAHHQKHQTDTRRTTSAMQSLLKMFNLSNAPTVPLDEEELSAEADEPPDDQISPLTNIPFANPERLYSKTLTRPQSNSRRESLLTRAILAESKPDESTHTSRGFSTTSSHSTASMASTAELTSDGDVTSQSRSATPSPPPPPGRFHNLLNMKRPSAEPVKVLIAPVTKDDKPSVADVGEAAIEKTLGRKRRIMFACGGTDSEQSKEKTTSEPKPSEPAPTKRKCALTFACPTRTSPDRVKNPIEKPISGPKFHQSSSPVPLSRHKTSQESVDLSGRSTDTTVAVPLQRPVRHSPKPSFHEFGSSHDETDAWVDRPSDHRGKLTLDDCMKKENEFRKLGKEAEEEAEDEEREQEELDLEIENSNEDDFAPSEDGSDGGNESDDEGGFASSDDESDGGSEYQFWAPSTTTAATSHENLPLSHFSSRQRSQASSLESLPDLTSPKMHSMMRPPHRTHRTTSSRAIRMRPGTPELPDSTDFVCGTLDEDRPLEAAYISCREQKKRMKHIPIPQDIDPSFPTTDPDDNEEDEEDIIADSQLSSEGPRWLKEQFAGFEEEPRGRRGSPAIKSTSPPSSTPSLHVTHVPKTVETRRGLHRSPPPPRKLFGHSPARMRSPPPARLRSPRGSPTGINVNFGFKLGMRGLGQRPTMERTASLPDTPNPFFRNFKIGSPSISNIASGAVTPSVEEPPRPDMHVRGPVYIVIGLEKKRQKRKEKFWRQHCRKVAREQANRRPPPGRGAERMKELGLECAERNKGYGLGPQTQLVISL